MYLLGYDIGSSSVKASLVDSQSGECVASTFYPRTEAPISSPRSGWAEQDPEMWWDNLKLEKAGNPGDILAIGISYQMHGLVCIDKDGRCLRPSIIWCDSRAVPYGQKAFERIGKERCLAHLLNSPGNFTAAKLAWVKDNEPEIFDRIDRIMLPGDYIAFRLTGEACTTVGGLSEGIFWDFSRNDVSEDVLSYFGFPGSVLAPICPTFGDQGRVLPSVAAELGIPAGIPVSYRAGDQPNNALSLNVFNPGEIASTAGTSGVVYGVNSNVAYDPRSRVNSFAHVNHSEKDPRIGVLLCINGTGALNSWVRRNVAPRDISYNEMNDAASEVPVGSDGLVVLPFGNGAERMLDNVNMGSKWCGVDFNRHCWKHILRASQEGIVFSFIYGMEIMKEMGMHIDRIHAGKANMFLSPVFRETLAGVSGAVIELYDTDGSVGAAKGAGMGVGLYRSNDEAFASLEKLAVITPSREEEYRAAYETWKSNLQIK